VEPRVSCMGSIISTTELHPNPILLCPNLCPSLLTRDVCEKILMLRTEKLPSWSDLKGLEFWLVEGSLSCLPLHLHILFALFVMPEWNILMCLGVDLRAIERCGLNGGETLLPNTLPEASRFWASAPACGKCDCPLCVLCHSPCCEATSEWVIDRVRCHMSLSPVSRHCPGFNRVHLMPEKRINVLQGNF
jgi:hypothetical protein